MADYIIEKATPEDTNQYLVKYLKEIEGADGKMVSVIDRRDTLKKDDLTAKLAGFDSQITAIEAEKAKVTKMLEDVVALG